MSNPYETFDSKNICWICLKPYTEHSEEDWARCTKANEARGKVIEELAKLVVRDDDVLPPGSGKSLTKEVIDKLEEEKNGRL